MKRYELHFAAHGEPVADVAATLTELTTEPFTLIPTYGAWDGIVEPAFIARFDSSEPETYFTSLAEDMAARFTQECVWITTTDITGSLVYGRNNA